MQEKKLYNKQFGMIMKKQISALLLLPLLLLMAGTDALYGQFNEAEGSADVTATVISTIDVVKLSDINFGLISSNITTAQPSLDPADAGEDANVLENGDPISVGKFEFEAAAEQTLIFTFGTAELQEGGGDELLFTPAVRGSQGDATTNSDARGGTTAISSNDTVELTGTYYTVWVGGALDANVGTDVPVNTGEYSGEFTITVDYDL